MLPLLLIGMGNALEHVTKLVAARDGCKLADFFSIDRIVPHALDDRNDDPLVGDELHHAVIQCGPLSRITLVDHCLVNLEELPANLLAVPLVPKQPLAAVRRESRVIAPRRIRPTSRSEHRGPSRQVRLVAHLHWWKGAPLIVLHVHLYADLGPHVGDRSADADHKLGTWQSHIGEFEYKAIGVAFLRQDLLREGRIVTVGLIGPFLPPVDAEAIGKPECRKRAWHLRLAGHHVFYDLRTVDGERQGLAHARSSDRIILHGPTPSAVELEHGLHGAGNGQHFKPSAIGTEHCLRAYRGDGGLAGAHHGNARAFLRDLEDVQVLEVWTATPMRVADGFELDSVARHTVNKFPGTAPNRPLAELLLTHRLEVNLGHDGALRCNGAAERRGKAELWLVGVDANRQVIDDIDALDRSTHRRRCRCQRFWRHLALEAKLYILGGKRIAVVEGLTGPQVKDPRQPVLGHLPSLGNARSHAAFFEIKADKAVVHCGLVDRVARTPFENRIEGLGSQRFNGED